MRERASVASVAGAWAESIDSVNALIDDLVHPTRENSPRDWCRGQRRSVAEHGYGHRGAEALKGEFLRTAKTVNTMVDQLSSFASEVTRVAREVGTEGKLGGQAKVKGVAGTWKDLDRQRELDGRQPDRPGAQMRP